MPKHSMKGALDASLSAEARAFQDRLAKADAQFSAAPGEEEVPQDGAPAVASPAPAPETANVSFTSAKVVREAFTIPEAEHAQIEAIRAQMLRGARAVSKSEVVRAGLVLLAEADESARLAVFERLERIKTGRPKTG